jgi:hypothetical protein
MYLFGDRDPEIDALLRDAGFQDLVRELFEGGEARIPEEVPPAFETAVRCGLLESDGTLYRAGGKLVVVPAAAERSLPSLLRPALAPYVEIAREVGAELREVYESLALVSRFKWPEVSHTLVAGTFLDLAMGSEAYRPGVVLRGPLPQTSVWAFPGVSAENGYGVQLSTGRGRLLFAQLWHRRSRREGLRLSPETVAELAKAARGEAAGGTSKELLYLRHLKLVAREDGGFRAQVPVFGPAETERLLPVLSEGARRLVHDVIVPALDMLVYDPYWRERADQDVYRHAAVRLILEYGIDRVIASRVLDPFPGREELPVAWGRWLWEEAEGPRTLVRSRVASQWEETA